MNETIQESGQLPPFKKFICNKHRRKSEDKKSPLTIVAKI